MRVRIVAPVLALATAVLLVTAACSTEASGGSTTPPVVPVVPARVA